MDERTIRTYSTHAGRYAADWREQPPPSDLYALIERYFVPRGRTADIGCGSGRDVAWLERHGFPTVGYDAAKGLIDEATAAYPSLAFAHAALPALEPIASGSFDNVLCETVIMHLPPDEVTNACARLVDILRPAGVLYLSWRVSDGDSSRDAAGRLYAAVDVACVMNGLRATEILLDADAINESSGKRVHRIVARRR